MSILKSNKGFSLIELLIVFSLIGILFMLLVPQVNSFFAKSHETNIRTDFRTFQISSETYMREVLGSSLNMDGLNKYLDVKHKVINNGTVYHTSSKDVWGNFYEVDIESKKITFSSYGKRRDSFVKVYNLVTYVHNGVIDSCTNGFSSGNIALTKFKHIPPSFVCGDPLSSEIPPSLETLFPPSNFKVTNSTTSSIDLSWDSVNGASEYILKRDTIIIYTGNNTIFSDISLNPSSNYEYMVASKNNVETSSFVSLNALTESTVSPPPSSPTNFRVENIKENELTLRWDSVSNATSYELKRDGIIVYSGANTNYKNTGLIRDTSYSYSLLAKNAYGESVPVYLDIRTIIDVQRVRLPNMGSGGCSPYDPYIIKTIGELQAIKLNLNACFELGRDIDASSTITWNSGKGFEPIGNLNGYTPRFDGKNFKISGLFINRPTEDYVGLFRMLGGKGVHNLKIENSAITGADYVGSIAGDSSNAISSSNIHITNGQVEGAYHVGGLFGEYDGDLNNVHYSGNIIGENFYIGGIVGSFSYSKMINVSSNVVIQAGSRAGGIVGYMYQSEIENSYALVDITGGTDLGGIIGYGSAIGSPKNLFARGEIKGLNYLYGLGIAFNNKLSNSFAAVKLIPSMSTANYALASGTTSSNSFWDVQITTFSPTADKHGVSKTTAEMKQLSTYAGWDFTSIWAINPLINNGYPYLKNLIPLP